MSYYYWPAVVAVYWLHDPSAKTIVHSFSGCKHTWDPYTHSLLNVRNWPRLFLAQSGWTTAGHVYKQSAGFLTVVVVATVGHSPSVLVHPIDFIKRKD